MSSLSPGGSGGGGGLSPTSPQGRKKKRELPPLFWYMETGEWDAAVDRVRKHPREVKLWATLRTKSDERHRNATTKRLALHHACFKLRSAGSVPPPFHPPSSSPHAAAVVVDDPFVAVCRFLLVVIRLYPEAAAQRESRHGCLPLHLAAFATCAPRSHSHPDSAAATYTGLGGASCATHTTAASTEADPPGRGPPPPPPASPSSFKATALFQAFAGGGGSSNHSTSHHSAASGGGDESAPAAAAPGHSVRPTKPGSIARRNASDATTGTMETAQTNLSAVHAEEMYAGGMGDKAMRAAKDKVVVNVSVASAGTLIHPKREELAVQVINALLDAYPKAIRVDSEGGRLPLHTACAGRATPRVISTLVTAYPAAARHRNKDGFLPLHLAAHWGVSHPNVAVILLKAYPDATVGRNRWERTPLEEALCMAGENGRPHQAALVRALRKHPNYWLNSPDVFTVPRPSTTTASGRHHPVDIDESLPSNDTSTEEDRRRYLQHGHEFLVDPEDIVERQQRQMGFAKSLHLPPPAPSGGLLGRLVSGASGGGATSPKKVGKLPPMDEDPSSTVHRLEALIQNRRWQAVLGRLASNPLEADQDLKVQTRGGFMSQSGFTPLHYACERQPPVEVVFALLEAHPGAAVTRGVPGGCLPIHTACTWYASGDVASALLSADPSTASSADELGNLPLHSACFSGSDEQVVLALLAAHPAAVLARNHQGSRPLDVCKRLRHDNRRTVMAILTLKKEEILSHHRRNQSSGTWADEAAAAGVGIAEGAGGYYRENDDLQEEHAMGVEVSYNDEENQDLLWI